MAKLNVPSLEKLEELFREIDTRNKEKTSPTEQEVLRETQATGKRSETNKARRMVRAVTDTNVIVLALTHTGKPRSLVPKLL